MLHYYRAVVNHGDKRAASAIPNKHIEWVNGTPMLNDAGYDKMRKLFGKDSDATTRKLRDS
ncbi:MAG: hypothetical protein GTO40_31270 [Deltaproteobacteria bacterium]|nr:hypothetical protein [Deltaproteobacteria bacterium]